MFELVPRRRERAFGKEVRYEERIEKQRGFVNFKVDFVFFGPSKSCPFNLDVECAIYKQLHDALRDFE